MGDADLPLPHTEPVGDLLALALEEKLRFPGREPPHLDVGQGDPPGPSGPQGLHDRLLGGEQPREELDPEWPRARLSLLALGKEPFGEPVAVPLERGPDAVDLDEV